MPSTETVSRVVDQHFTMSLWYAWGRIDSGVYGDKLDHGDGFTFAGEQADLAEAFYSEKRPAMPPIIAAWEAYADGRLNA